MSSLPSYDQSDSSWPAILSSLLLRAVFFVTCRLYVQQYLVADLQSVEDEDSYSAPHYQKLEELPLGDLSNHHSSLAIHGESDAAAPEPRMREDKRIKHEESEQASRRAGTAARLTFCFTFSESCTLCTLVLAANLTSERARWLNWTISTTALLSIVLVVVPFLQCLLVATRNKGLSPKVLLATFILFAIYGIAFNRGGIWLSEAVGIEAGSHRIGYANQALQQLCVPGVLLIGGLSGAGAVNTAWNAWEWRQRYSAAPITDEVFNNVLASLKRARQERLARTAEMEAASSAASQANTSGSFFSRLTTSDPTQAGLSGLQAEIRGYEALEKQLAEDLQSLEVRRKTAQLSGTLKGRLFTTFGYLFTWYCVARVFFSAVGFLLGLDKAQRESAGDNIAGRGSTSATSRLVGVAASAFGLSVDVTTWSRLIGLVLVGVIIVVNLRVVLSSVSRAFKRLASSSGGAAFLLLFLSQLMAIYLLTFLISLPDSGDSGAQDLLRSLPDFAVFTRLFDGVFVAAAGGMSLLRYVQRKLTMTEDIHGSGMV